MDIVKKTRLIANISEFDGIGIVSNFELKLSFQENLPDLMYCS